MRNFKFIFFILLHHLLTIYAITMKQFDESLDNLRGACAPKFKITTDQLDKLRAGNFEENNNEIKCYTKCIAQMSGTLSKKGEIIPARAFGQVDLLIPPELQIDTRNALTECLDTQYNYKNSCDKTFYVFKCIRNFKPEKFKFP